MKICAIVLNYRNAASTKACLDSLSNQSLDTVLVVDNSADQRFDDELAEMLARQSGVMDYRLKLLNPGSNLGFARGVNFALNEAEMLCCDAFLLINNDALASSGMVARLAAALAGDDRLIVAPAVVDAAGVQQPMLWYQRFFGLLTKRQLPGSFPYLNGCCLLVRREILADSNKLFDENFFMYGEDTLLGWYMECAGKVLHRVDDAVVRHSSGGSSRQGQFFYEYHTARAHVILALKAKRSLYEIPLLLLFKSIGLVLRAILRSVRYSSGIPLLAFILAWFPMKVRVPK